MFCMQKKNPECTKVPFSLNFQRYCICMYIISGSRYQIRRVKVKVQNFSEITLEGYWTSVVEVCFLGVHLVLYVLL